VLCWDIFDYLGPAAGGVLAGELIRLLRPGGLLLGFFGARASEETRYTKYFIEDESRLRYRFYTGACRRRWVLQSRENPGSQFPRPARLHQLLEWQQ